MAKRTIALGAVLAASGFWTLPLYAQAITGGGCAALADAVRASVRDIVSEAGSGLRTRPAAGTPARLAEGAAPQTCGRTAAVASAAFGFAMASFNLPVRWNDRGPLPPGDYCPSPDLAQCYPGRPRSMELAVQRRPFVTDVWQGVVAGIRQQMPFGTASDISYFRTTDLANTLAISLSVTVEGRHRRRRTFAQSCYRADSLARVRRTAASAALRIAAVLIAPHRHLSRQATAIGAKTSHAAATCRYD